MLQEDWKAELSTQADSVCTAVSSSIEEYHRDSGNVHGFSGSVYLAMKMMDF